MQLMKRISRYVSANLNHLLDQAEDPETLVRQLIREMEESIAEVRRETVRAVSRQKQLEKQIAAADDGSSDLEGKAKLALSKGEEDLARRAVARRLLTVRTSESLRDELRSATELAERLKDNLSRLEDQVQAARRKRDELVRRRRAAEAEQRTHAATRRSTETLRHVTESVAAIAGANDVIASYEANVQRLEADAEAEREVLDRQIERELDLQKLADENAIDEEIRRLKNEVTAAK